MKIVDLSHPITADMPACDAPSCNSRSSSVNVTSAKSPNARYEIADRWIELEVGYQVAYRVPYLEAQGQTPTHEASVSKVNEEMIFYMQQRGLTEGQAMSLSVNGFINDLARQFPMEYSVELKRLIDLEMEGSVG